MNLGGNSRGVLLINTACKLKTTFLNSLIFIGTIEKQVPVSLFFLKSYLAPSLKVKLYNKSLPSTSLLQLYIHRDDKATTFFPNFSPNQLQSYNYFIIPLPKDPFSVQKDNITLKVHLISRICDSQIC